MEVLEIRWIVIKRLDREDRVWRDIGKKGGKDGGWKLMLKRVLKIEVMIWKRIYIR